MTNYSEELIEKFKGSQNSEEIKALLEEYGEDADEKTVETIWNEVEERRRIKEQEQEQGQEQELSLDELEEIAGGVTRRSWFRDGCAATVETGSDCWGTDGGCSVCNIDYSLKPNNYCPRCGASACVITHCVYSVYLEVWCRNCGKFEEKH